MEHLRKIVSVSNEKIKYFSSLADKKIRNKENLFIVEGYHLVEEAAKTENLRAVIATDEKDLIKFKNIEKYLVTKPIIEKLSTTKSPQQILGVVKTFNHSISLLHKMIKQDEIKLVILDEINDPGNLGTIIRTAAALGYDCLIMSHNTVDLYNEKVIRATQGVLFKIPIVRGDLLEIIPTLKKENIKCFGTSLEQTQSLHEVKHTNKFALCFGNEARGISKEVMNLLDQNIKIEMKNDVESLNVSVASGIIMYELLQK